jgi:hypothetical protein
MTTTTKIALAAVLFSAFASTSFAASQDVASVTENSGRILAPHTQIYVPLYVPRAYASAAHVGWRRVMAGTPDFQLQGRGLGRGM